MQKKVDRNLLSGWEVYANKIEKINLYLPLYLYL